MRTLPEILRCAALLDKPSKPSRLGANARAYTQTNSDLKSIRLPCQLAWVKSLAGRTALYTP